MVTKQEGAPTELNSSECKKDFLIDIENYKISTQSKNQVTNIFYRKFKNFFSDQKIYALKVISIVKNDRQNRPTHQVCAELISLTAGIPLCARLMSIGPALYSILDIRNALQLHSMNKKEAISYQNSSAEKQKINAKQFLAD